MDVDSNNSISNRDEEIENVDSFTYLRSELAAGGGGTMRDIEKRICKQRGVRFVQSEETLPYADKLRLLKSNVLSVIALWIEFLEDPSKIYFEIASFRKQMPSFL